MDDFKPEDDMKADRNDRRAGRSRQSSERDADPQINFDDVDLDADEGRPTRAGKARREREEEEFEEELDAQDEEMLEEQPVERRPRKRKKAPAKPASRQYIMMGVGILVLLLLILWQLHRCLGVRLHLLRGLFPPAAAAACCTGAAWLCHTYAQPLGMLLSAAAASGVGCLVYLAVWGLLMRCRKRKALI